MVMGVDKAGYDQPIACIDDTDTARFNRNLLCNVWSDPVDTVSDDENIRERRLVSITTVVVDPSAFNQYRLIGLLHRLSPVLANCDVAVPITLVPSRVAIALPAADPMTTTSNS